MHFTALKTPIITKNQDLFSVFCDVVLEKNIKIFEDSVLVISSKVVSVCQGRIVSKDEKQKYIEDTSSEILTKKNNFSLTVTNEIIIPNAGIDSSNITNDEVVLWPENPQKYADEFCEKIKKKYRTQNIGIIISDSRITPRRQGTTGVALAWSGITGVFDLRGKTDIYGNILKVSTVNIADNICSGAEVLMGQADEKTPFILVENLPHQYFTDEPQDPERAIISRQEDLFDI